MIAIAIVLRAISAIGADTGKSVSTILSSVLPSLLNRHTISLQGTRERVYQMLVDLYCLVSRSEEAFEDPKASQEYERSPGSAPAIMG